MTLEEINKRELGVHRTHCCVFHGCKYGEDSTCPVVQQEVMQNYLCDECGNQGVQSIEHLKRLLEYK